LSGARDRRREEVTVTGTQTTAVRALAGPLAADLGLLLYDVEIVGAGRARTLRVTVERPGGVDLDAVTAFTRALSPALDACTDLGGPYLLEVTSPGVERALRTPDHFRAALGATVALRVRADGGAARHQGRLETADDTGCTVVVDGVPRRVAYDDITKARTVFEWGPASPPGAARRTKGSARRRAKETSRS
jgi:ribosome maturation factor RimP